MRHCSNHPCPTLLSIATRNMLCVLLSQAKVILKPLVDILNKLHRSLSLKGSTHLNLAQALSLKVSFENLVGLL